jgi:cyanophycinase
MTIKNIAMPRAAPGTLHVGAKLAIIGGRFEGDNRDVFTAMHALSGGRIAVLPTASAEPREVGEEARNSFREYGFVSEIVPIDKDNYRTAANDPAVVRMLDGFGSFYFTGGDQALIVKALAPGGVPTPALAAIRRCWLAGGLVAGSSAGAAIMSHPMITGGNSLEALALPPASEPHDTLLSLGDGLGFFPYGLVDQHFLQRGRLGRLVAALLASGWKRGFGIDENTAMVVSDGLLRVLGETGMIYVDISRATGKRDRLAMEGLKVSYLDRGDSMDLATMKVHPGPAKRPVQPRERYFRAPSRISKAAFAAYATHETMARLVEGDPSVYRTERSWAYDHASSTEVAVSITRGRGAKALIEPTQSGARISAIGFDLRLDIRKATTAEHYRTRLLAPAADQPIPAPTPRVGRLILLGSPPRAGAAIFQDLRGLLAGPVGVIATASAEPKSVAAETVLLLEQNGIPAIDLGASIETLRTEAGREALIARFGAVGSFLITGGNQRRLIDGLLFRGEETPVLRALMDAWRRHRGGQRRRVRPVAADDRGRQQSGCVAPRCGIGRIAPGSAREGRSRIVRCRHPGPEHAERAPLGPAHRRLRGGSDALRVRPV